MDYYELGEYQQGVLFPDKISGLLFLDDNLILQRDIKGLIEQPFTFFSM